MLIGIDCRQFYDVQSNIGAGVERYAYHLVRNILHEDKTNNFVLFFYSDISSQTIRKVKGNNSRVKIVKLNKPGLRIPFYESHVKTAHVFNKEKLDNCLFLANSMPFFYRGNAILVVHDLAIYKDPEWFPSRQFLSTKIIVPRSLDRTKKIIAVSQNTKKDLLEIFKLPEQKIEVVYPGVAVKDNYLLDDFEKVRQKYDLSRKYFLFVGTIEPRKNLRSLIEAFGDFCFESGQVDYNLLLAGTKGWKFNDVFEAITEINKKLSGQRVKYIGKLTNRERNILLKNCLAFVYPSFYEGFGLPIVEAMALGAPVICGDNSAQKEIVGQSACLVNPNCYLEIKNSLKKMIDEKEFRQSLIEAGKLTADNFKWGKSAEEVLKIITNL